MTTSIPGMTDPCPNCGSMNVRWRRRRFYDVILTYLRYLVDAAAGGGQRATTVGSGISTRGVQDRLRAAQYQKERAVYEARIGTTTASRFWKCPDCRQKGQVFGEISGVLAERERLAGVEDQIEDNLGGVSHQIESDRPPED